MRRGHRANTSRDAEIAVALQNDESNPESTLPPPAAPLVSADRDRLLLRLDQYDLTEKIVTGDGACQFRSLSDQLYGTPDHHDIVRQAVVQQLQQNQGHYSMYVPTTYETYCSDMKNHASWGDHVTLQAAADVYGLEIMVLTSFKENCTIKIQPLKKTQQQGAVAQLLG